MKKKLTYRICGILACMGLSMAFAGAGASYLQPPQPIINASAAETVTWGDTVKTSYMLGEVFAPPAEIPVQKESAHATAYFKALVLPDGSIMDASEYVFSQKGKYKLLYTYQIANVPVTYEVEREFEVLDSCYSVKSSSTEVSFGEIKTHKNAVGYDVLLQAGDSFTYTKPVNVYQNDRTNIMTYNTTLVEGKMMQSAYGQPIAIDAENLVVTLTDCYDPSISVSCTMHFTKDMGSGIYYRASATGHGDFGLGKNNPANVAQTVIIDGQLYGVNSVGTYGGSMTMTTGQTRPGYISWSFEKDTNRIYLTVGSDGTYQYVGQYGDPVTQSKCEYELLVNDIDNKDISPNAFVGFTTGEVYVSISCTNWINSSTRLQIEQIGEAREDTLDSYVDETAPEVEIDTKGAKAPFYVQRGQKFDLFDALAYDVNLSGTPKAKVYYNYDNAMRSAVAVKDGTFTPTAVGTYTVEYTAKDNFGNVGVSTVSILSIDEPVTKLTTEQISGELMAGVMAQLPAYSIYSLDGADAVSVSIALINASGKEYPIDANTLQFVPINAGKNTIVYTYTDKLYTYTYSYDVQVAQNPNPGFIELPKIQGFYLKNAYYTVDDVTAYDFHENGDPTPAATEVYVRFDGGTYKKVEDLTSLAIIGTNSVQFKYVSGVTEYETAIAPIREVGYGSAIRMQDYFDGDFTATANSMNISFLSNKKSGDNTLQFVMPLAQVNFALGFRIPKEYANISSYAVIVEDMASSKSLVITYKADSAGTFRAYIGDTGVAVGGTMNDGQERAITYLPMDKQLQFESLSDTVQVPYEFDFAGDTCKVSFRLNGILGDAGVEILKVQNQIMSNSAYDMFEPQIYAPKPKGFMEKGETVTISKAIVSDVLCSILDKNFTLSVMSMTTGQFAVSLDGIELKNVAPDRDYQFVLGEYGKYRVVYTAQDGAGNVTSKPYIIYSADMEAPTVQFDDGTLADDVQTMQVNHFYNVKSFTARDNYTAAEKLDTHILIYDTRTSIVFFDREVVCFTELGRYTVCVYCMDEEGNYSYITYQIEVVPADSAEA